MIRLFRATVAPEASALVAGVLESGYLGEGPRVAEFERLLCEATSHPYVRVTNSGTAALCLAYHLAGIGPDSVVGATPLTCLAATEPLLHLGARIRWLDIDPETGLLGSVNRGRLLHEYAPITHVLGCDWGGSTLGVPESIAVCDDRGVTYIEDAAHAVGACYDDGTAAGTKAHFAAYSFQAIKTLTTGDGGALLTRHAHHAEQARLLRWFGLDRTRGESMRCYQQVPFPGFKAQMNDVAAAIGLANLPHLAGWVDMQRRHAAAYDTVFADSPIRPLRRSAWSSCWLYSVRVPDAQAFIRAMATRGVECSQVHARNDTQAIFRRATVGGRALPGMDELERTLVCLPVGHWLTADDVATVARAALDCVERAAA